MAKVSAYGAVADGVTNCAAAINKCAWETGVVEFDAGTYIIGTSSPAVSDPTQLILFWGFPQKYTRGIKFIGKGKGQTILKFADNNRAHVVIPYGAAIFMLNTYSPGEDGSQDCGDCVIQGITFDGNYDNNYNATDPNYKTVCGVRLVGRNNLIENCEFKGFGVGVANQESFALQSYLPSTAPDGSQGAIVRNCTFGSPGANTRNVAPGVTVEALTWVAVGGNGVTSKYATGVVVEGCSFVNNPFGASQRSPLHGITPAAAKGVTIRNNTFTDFAGQCIYVDSYKNYDVVVENNSATLCRNFISLVTQNWVRLTGNPSYAPLISSHVNWTIRSNNITLSGASSWYYNYQLAPYNAVFLLYQYDRDVTDTYNPTVIPGFKRIDIYGNTINGSLGGDIVFNNGGYWPATGAFANGEPYGPVPNITDVRILTEAEIPGGARSWNFKPVVLNTPVSAKDAKPVILNRLTYKSLTVAGFAVSLEDWAGASRVFAIQDILIPNQNFCIRPGQGFEVPNYVMTVKWVAQGAVRRYKLWTSNYELLSYPLYSGEIIPGEGAQFEYWSTSYTNEPFAAAFELLTDILEKPDDCCDQSGTALANGICEIGDLPNPYPAVYPSTNFETCVI